MNKNKVFYSVALALVAVILVIVLFTVFKDKVGNKPGSAQMAEGAVVLLTADGSTVNQEAVQDFNKFIAEAKQPVFVDFWAPWCSPCRLAAPFVEQLAHEYADKALIIKINVDDAKDLARQYNAQSIPQFSIFKDGKLIESAAGYADSMQGKYRQMIDRQLP